MFVAQVGTDAFRFQKALKGANGHAVLISEYFSHEFEIVSNNKE